MRLYLVTQYDELNYSTNSIGLFQHKYKAEQIARKINGCVEEFKLKQNKDEEKSFEFEYLEFEPSNLETFDER